MGAGLVGNRQGMGQPWALNLPGLGLWFQPTLCSPGSRAQWLALVLGPSAGSGSNQGVGKLLTSWQRGWPALWWALDSLRVKATRLYLPICAEASLDAFVEVFCASPVLCVS